ncbi:hypothetical protein Agub_g15676 [Astrephomene gubernaculifera]|uniref:Dickkopf N-terminal cysteine-rich domain-containing protein n=1 Tax=Astrephomene gubernaculifera TaxID=47775 RepID=A0AAD3HU47_9CHLO|nr:hypothetical protein Agub_g15676 [Astrephomene gubernaculifera]
MRAPIRALLALLLAAALAAPALAARSTGILVQEVEVISKRDGCKSDGDCNRSEACIKGECLRLKDDGEVCKADQECISGTCQTSWWPAGSVCVTTCDDSKECPESHPICNTSPFGTGSRSGGWGMGGMMQWADRQEEEEEEDEEHAREEDEEVEVEDEDDEDDEDDVEDDADDQDGGNTQKRRQALVNSAAFGQQRARSSVDRSASAAMNKAMRDAGMSGGMASGQQVDVEQMNQAMSQPGVVEEMAEAMTESGVPGAGAMAQAMSSGVAGEMMEGSGVAGGAARGAGFGSEMMNGGGAQRKKAPCNNGGRRRAIESEKKKAGRCVQCMEDKDCDDGFYCERSYKKNGRTCLKYGPRCESFGDCRMGEYCDSGAQRCRPYAFCGAFKSMMGGF